MSYDEEEDVLKMDEDMDDPLDEEPLEFDDEDFEDDEDPDKDH